jgi:adenylate cyclase
LSGARDAAYWHICDKTAASLKQRHRPANLEVYDLVLRGRAEWVHSPEAGVEAIPLFERAIALDPNYSDAYIWLAYSQNHAWAFMNRPLDPFRQLAVASATRAVELDPDYSGAHCALAVNISDGIPANIGRGPGATRPIKGSA